MIRALALAAALAVLPAAASAQSVAVSVGVDAAAEHLDARIERAIKLSLNDDMQAVADAVLVPALNLVEAIDVQLLSLQALDSNVASVSALASIGSLATVGGLANHGAWARPDPDQIVTYGLMADYALNEAAEDAEDAEDE